jgi:hypothetical protein
MANSGITFMRGELEWMLPVYERVFDCLIGAPALKGWIPAEPWFLTAPLSGAQSMGTFMRDKRERYLPKPNPTDTSEANWARYNDYVRRAVWYNVPDRTLKGLVGQIFLRDPQAELPNTLDMVKADCDGTGRPLIQVAKQAARTVIAYGRGGFLVDYPTDQDIQNSNNAANALEGDDGASAATGIQDESNVTTVAALEAGQIRPTITWYDPWNIINWRTRRIGANVVLSMVVLQERMFVDGADYDQVEYMQYRVLALDADGQHYGEVWSNFDPELGTKAQGEPQLRKAYTPRDSAGNAYQGKLPFMLVGAETNTPTPQKAPLDDLCEIALGHYRNSADYEEMIYMVGQPTTAISGLSQDWVDNVLKGQVLLGSRSAIPLPPGADAKILQVEANSLVGEAMKEKEAQMVAIGAKLVQEVKGSRTATEMILNTISESSTLANIADNISDVLEWALGWSLSFISGDASHAQATLPTAGRTGNDPQKEKPNGITYRLNKEFDINQTSSDQIASIVKLWESGAITTEEMRAQLTKAGLATMDFASYMAAIKEQLADQPQPMVYILPGADGTAEDPPFGGKNAQTAESPQPGQGGAPGAAGKPGAPAQAQVVQTKKPTPTGGHKGAGGF